MRDSIKVIEIVGEPGESLESVHRRLAHAVAEAMSQCEVPLPKDPPTVEVIKDERRRGLQ